MFAPGAFKIGVEALALASKALALKSRPKTRLKPWTPGPPAHKKIAPQYTEGLRKSNSPTHKVEF